MGPTLEAAASVQVALSLATNARKAQGRPTQSGQTCKSPRQEPGLAASSGCVCRSRAPYSTRTRQCAHRSSPLPTRRASPAYRRVHLATNYGGHETVPRPSQAPPPALSALHQPRRSTHAACMAPPGTSSAGRCVNQRWLIGNRSQPSRSHSTSALGFGDEGAILLCYALCEMKRNQADSIQCTRKRAPPCLARGYHTSSTKEHPAQRDIIHPWRARRRQSS